MHERQSFESAAPRAAYENRHVNFEQGKTLMFNLTCQQIERYLAGTSYEGSHCPPNARAYRPPTKAQQLALAMEERMVFINVEVRPSPHSRDVVPVYGESLDTLPTIRTSLDFSDADRGIQLQEVRAFVGLTRSSRRQGVRAFLPQREHWKPTHVGKALLPLIGTLNGLAPRVCANLHPDPYVRLAVDTYRTCGLHQLVQQRVQVAPRPEMWMGGYINSVTANLCNTFVQKLSESANHNNAGKQEFMHKTMHDNRCRELREYLSIVPKHHPGAHIVRVELSQLGVSWATMRANSESMVAASTQGLRELKQRYGDAIVADVRKLDIGPAGNTIVHLLLAIDGPTDSEMQGLNRTLLEVWDRLFPNQGAVVNCNDFDQFVYRGSGSLIRQHESLASQLDNAIVFLADTDRLIQVGYDGAGSGLILGTVAGRTSS